MSTDNSPTQALQDSITQLAHSFRATETTLPVEQITECLDRLQDCDKTALRRLCYLILRNDGHTASSKPVPRHTRTWTTGDTPSLSSSVSCSAIPSSDHSSLMPSSTIVAPFPLRNNKAATNSRPSSSQPSVKPRKRKANVSVVPTSATAPNGPIINPARGSSNNSPVLLPIDRQATTTPSLLSEPCSAPPEAPAGSALATLGLAWRVESTFQAIISADEPGTFGFSPTIESLFQSCILDPSCFLKAVADGKVTLPNGQGWEAAIATKRYNSDLRDLTRIFHRFECYNIYQHVVDAGYHTGVHWVREKRTQLAEKLSQEFPGCFPDPKAANKCLNWVDQGCCYREWAERLSGSGINLGYLLALPCHVPHSTYTSRCTKEQMAFTVIELKALGIDKVVDKMKLSKLASHIVKSLHEMTTRKDRASPETQYNGPPLTVRVEPPPTPPEINMDSTMFDASHYTFDAFEDWWLEDWTTEEMGGSTFRSCVGSDTAAGVPPCSISRADLPSPALSNGIITSPAATTDPFNEWYQQ